MEPTGGGGSPGWWLASDGQWYPPDAEPTGVFGDESPLEVELSYSKGDYWKAFRQRFADARSLRVKFALALVVYGVFVALLLGAAGGLTLFFGVEMIVFIAAVPVFGIVYDRRLQRAGPRPIVFSEQGMWSPLRKRMLEWHQVLEVSETPDFYMVRARSIPSTRFLPKRAFSPEQDRRLRNVVSRHTRTRFREEAI